MTSIKPLFLIVLIKFLIGPHQMFMFPRLVITPPNHLRTNITIGVTNKYAIRPLLLNPQENSSNTSALEVLQNSCQESGPYSENHFENLISPICV